MDRKSITREQAEYLLQLPKKPMDGGGVIINLRNEKNIMELYSPDDDEWKFLLQIRSNRKITFRLSLHHQENNLREGLLRVDFNAGHKNPETVNAYVPDLLKPFAGKWFRNESHIHLFVEGYGDLAWAVPLKDYEHFPVKEVSSGPDFPGAVRCFAKAINLVPRLGFEGELPWIG